MLLDAAFICCYSLDRETYKRLNMAIVRLFSGLTPSIRTIDEEPCSEFARTSTQDDVDCRNHMMVDARCGQM